MGSFNPIYLLTQSKVPLCQEIGPDKYPVSVRTRPLVFDGSLPTEHHISERKGEIKR